MRGLSRNKIRKRNQWPSQHCQALSRKDSPKKRIYSSITNNSRNTHSLLHMIELSKHEVYIDEDNGEAQDEVLDITPDSTGSNISKTVGNIHLKFKNILNKHYK